MRGNKVAIASHGRRFYGRLGGSTSQEIGTGGTRSEAGTHQRNTAYGRAGLFHPGHRGLPMLRGKGHHFAYNTIAGPDERTTSHGGIDQRIDTRRTASCKDERSEHSVDHLVS
jgi:hypothetical protein